MPPTNPLITDIPQTLGRRIGLSQSGGHAIPWSARQRPDGTIPGQMISRWTTAGDFRIDPLDWPLTFGNQTAETAFVGSRMVITDCPSVGPVNWAEYDPGTLQRLANGQFGDNKSRFGCSCQTPYGAVFVNFVTFDPDTTVYGFDVSLRRELPPSPTPTPAWITNRITFPNLDTGAFTSPMDCVYAGGFVYVFHGFDGSGRWDLLIINVSALASGGQMWYEHKVNFIARNSGPISPSIEIPQITASYDSANSRILLAYQNTEQHQTGCPGGSEVFAYPEIIVAVALPSLTVTFIMAEPWDDFHTPNPPTPTWARPDGIYFAAQKRQQCQTSQSIYRLEPAGTITQLTADIPGGRTVAFSSDGWIIYYDPAEALPYITYLVEFLPVPVTTVAPYEIVGGQVKSVKVSWTNSTIADLLEVVSDINTPNDQIGSIVYRGAGPAIIPVEGIPTPEKPVEAYFRVRR